MLFAFILAAAPSPAFAQQRTVTGKVTNEQSLALAGVSVAVKGTQTATTTNNQGDYSIAAEAGQILQFRFIGTALVERPVGVEDVINVQLRRVALDLDAVVVTALGETASQRSLGTAQQSVRGTEIAETKRENFINALSGRVAGIDVTSTSGVPGASSSIVIRGVSSISSSNQPLIIVDGLPIDNRTVNTGVLASDKSSTTAFSNRGVDFTNRAADVNSEDIETLTVLKGPEAAALYGIDAANGAIVIRTKRGRAGGGMQYSSSARVERTQANYQLQRVYGPSGLAVGGTINSFQYFGAPYAPGTQFYDNIDGFLRTAVSQQHNLSFSGATEGEAGPVALMRRILMSRSAPVVCQVATPNGLDRSMSPARREILRPAMDWSTIFSSSIHASICSRRTRNRSRCQRPASNFMYLVVSFSDASRPSMLDNPTTPPPQPPTISVQNESCTGKVRPQKKSLPSTFIASSDTS